MVFCQLEVNQTFEYKELALTIVVYVLDINLTLTEITEHRRGHGIRNLGFGFVNI